MQAVWNGLLKHGLADNSQLEEYQNKAWEYHGMQSQETPYGMQSYCWDADYMPEEIPAKIHTIREDKGDRWRPGAKIHFVIGNRTKHRFQFAPVVPVVSIQEIIIVKNRNNFNYNENIMRIYIDGTMRNFAADDLHTNDGFPSWDYFYRWWPEGTWEGRIIHWTDKRY